jgi:hypothetical protein
MTKNKSQIISKYQLIKIQNGSICLDFRIFEFEIYLFFDDCFLNILPKLHQYIKTRVKLNP